ncbi:MAG: 30S ribosomal protein THX [Flavobacteriales bacterium]|nr:30S ribosomal protein THX [Flavobacteriales bacterium]
MGKGDIKTKKGKRFAGSYGVSRKRKDDVAVIEVNPKKKATKKAEPQSLAENKPAAKKTTAKKSADK